MTDKPEQTPQMQLEESQAPSGQAQEPSSDAGMAEVLAELQKIGFSRDEEVALRNIHPVLTSLQEISDANYVARWLQSIYMQICDAVSIPYSQETLESVRSLTERG